MASWLTPQGAGTGAAASASVASGAPGVTLTERAARRIRAIAAGEPPGSMLRVSVNGGGCSGFSYAFAFDTARADDDWVVEVEGATLLVDATSQPYLENATVDYVEDLMGSSFRITNPNATSSCGCGTSFSI